MYLINVYDHTRVDAYEDSEEETNVGTLCRNVRASLVEYFLLKNLDMCK